ncbi:MAG TPA: hypothetical protein VMS64_31240 [Candidatus Methylomirabilis sp.]|nr:hypothetical protein [Candidatus Methylomirabilis sp.]
MAKSFSPKAMAVVAYDKRTGAIVHVHHVITMTGARQTPEKDLRKTALQDTADRCGRRVSEIDTIVVESKQLEGPKTFRVDPAKRKVVASKGQGQSGGSFGTTFPPPK